MATSAAAQANVFALRQQIAKIEGRLADDLSVPLRGGSTVFRQGGKAWKGPAFLRTGVERLDEMLGGGLPRSALIELHSAETRDSALSAGFALALAALTASEAETSHPLLWIGTSEIFREAGYPYARGLAQSFGLAPENLLICESARLADGLWIAEEAAGLTALSLVILELRGNPEKLDLTATRRLHRRAALAGCPVLLLRQSAEATPTAAPLRLIVGPAPAAKRKTLAGPLRGSIAHPAFTVSISKNRMGLAGTFVLEWNSHDLAFHEREPTHTRRLVPASADGADLAPTARSILAFDASRRDAAAGPQLPREQHHARLRPRRAG